MAIYYASPTGGGSGSLGSPFLVSNFWGVNSGAGPNPGDRLKMVDGIYVGANSMIAPFFQSAPAGLSGNPGNPIVVEALNDGGVTIDGEHVNSPVYIRENNWFDIQGIDVHSSGPQSGGVPVVAVRDSHDLNFKRICAWDTDDDNSIVFEISRVSTQSYNVLAEDCAAFGVGRKMFTGAQARPTLGTLTFRRCWGRWQGCTNTGPKVTFELTYNNANTFFENVIGTWNQESMPESYTLQNNGTPFQMGVGEVPPNPGPATTYSGYEINFPYGNTGTGANDQGDLNAAMRGSIFYVLIPLPGAPVGNNNQSQAALFLNAQVTGEFDEFTFLNVVALQQDSSKPAILLNGATPDLVNVAINSFTSIGGSGNSIASEWTQTNPDVGATINDVSSIWSSGTGAQVLKRYVDGTLTGDDLWPWPMDDRIKAAIAKTSYSTVTAGTGGPDDGKVTTAMQNLFGPIPGLGGTPMVPSDIFKIFAM